MRAWSRFSMIRLTFPYADRPRPAVTCLSGRALKRPVIAGRLLAFVSRLGLARRWLSLVLVGMLASGCLVTSVPEYGEPKRTPPFLLGATAKPPLEETLNLFKGGQGLSTE